MKTLLKIAASGLRLLFRKRPDTNPARQPYVSPYKVEFDDLEVRVIYQGKLHESTKWLDLTAVGVRIDESFLPAPWWMLFTGPSSGCMYPSEAAGGQEMLKAMQERLPGFDNSAVIEAMGLMEGGRLVWSKSSQQGVQEDRGQQGEQAGQGDRDHHQQINRDAQQ
jgi:hypothetical protein